MECLYLVIICDEPRSPRRGAPAADKCLYIYLQIPHCPAVPRSGPDAGNSPEITWFNDFHGSGVNSRLYPFHQTAHHQFNGGDSACPPGPPLRFVIVSYYLPGIYHYRVPRWQGWRNYVPLLRKSVEKNIVRISTRAEKL
jgi:hypothetical protein